ncbi:haloacid dehalogenase [Candidatus Magnetominusculus xianensis]|uniref:Haloacid dehalogenase n=2 Tax=Candidatus Magnetominusculus xianensis TaxID=1748249 RepID=A0ABR5SFZ4_9BACT|nr:haloacid dehalogenase [Candidatus Magnetominusculus xianensis]
MTKLKGVFFDIGSTLVMGPNLSPNKEIALMINRPEVDADAIGKVIMVKEFRGPSDVIKHITSLDIDDPRAVESGIAKLWDRQEKDAIEISGATQSVVSLKQMGLRLGLISDIWVPYYESVKRACPAIIEAVDSATLSFKEGLKKPDTLLFKRALLSLDLAPDEAVMVGDSYSSDIEPAMKIGMTTIWVLSRPEREIDSIINVIYGKSQKPDYIVGNISNLLQLNIWR